MAYISIEKAIDLIKEGEVVAFPTETVYGLGADARNPDAVKKVFEIKGRPPDNPLIVHIASKEMVREFTAEVPPDARTLMDRFWPGPLTLIFKKKPSVPDIVTAGLDTVALRWPSHPISQELIFRSSPLVAPSANKSGKPSPTRAEHVVEDFGDEVNVINGGQTQIGLESTVLDVSEAPYTILRPGYIGKEDISTATGQQVRVSTDVTEGPSKSPGTKYIHYAPNASVRWLNDEPVEASTHILFLVHSLDVPDADNVINFEDDYSRFASELYECFRKADREGYETILVEPLEHVKTESHFEPVVDALENRISKAIGKNGQQ